MREYFLCGLVLSSFNALDPLGGLSLSRFDVEGDMLAELVVASVNGKLAGSHRHEFLRHLADQRRYPQDVIIALGSVLFPEIGMEAVDFHSNLINLAGVCVASLNNNDSGLCYSLLGILSSISPGVFSPTQLHMVQQSLPGHADQNSLPDLLFAASMEQSSTFGTLISFQRFKNRKEVLSDENICTTFAEKFLNIARDAASEDVLSDLLSPGPVDFKRMAPRNFISADLFESSASEGLEYYIHLMRENAASLSSAMMFGGEDVLDFFDIEEDIDMEEMIQSAKDFEYLDEDQIAQDLISTINSARYNLNALRFNEALGLVSGRSAAECVKGVELLAKIATTQSLLVKVFFFLMKISFFQLHKNPDALWFSMVMNELGVPYSPQYIRDIFQYSTEQVSQTFIPRSCPIMQFVSDEMECGGTAIAFDLFSELSCLNACVANTECNFVAYVGKKQECWQYSQCRTVHSSGLDSRLLKRVDLVPEIDCFVKSTSTKCFEDTYLYASRIYDDPDSVFWLMYHYIDSKRLDEGLALARTAAANGYPEGTYQMASLLSTRWEGHEPDWDTSLKIFQSMLLNPTQAAIVTDPVLGNIDSFQKLEFEAVQEIAEKIGIYDAALTTQTHTIGSPLVQRAAGLVGIFLLCSRQYWYLVARVVTVTALIAGLVVLVFRRSG